MNLEQFYQWATNPRRPISNFLGTFSGECVSLISQYLNKCFFLKPGAWGNAADYWHKTNPEILNLFYKIQTRDFQAGDILVWGPTDPKNKTNLGHVAIWYNNKMLNQNYNGQKYVSLNNFLSADFLGVLRPKNTNNLIPKSNGTAELSFEFYEIRAGDTFWDLENAWGFKHGRLQELNPGQDPRKLQIGQKIRVKSKLNESESTTKRFYIIKAGDTFWDLENAWGLKNGRLQELNPGQDPRKLQIGQKIRVA